MRGASTISLRRAPVPVLSLLALLGCGGEPPEELAGFRLGMSQAEVTAAAGEIGGFTCRFRGTRPPTMICDGPAPEGPVSVVAVEDATGLIRLELDPEGRDPQRTMRRFVRGFGEPVWRERSVPAPAGPGEGYHTFWLDADSTRAIAAVCVGRELEPPCTIELTTTSPAAVEAKLDSLLGLAGRRP